MTKKSKSFTDTLQGDVRDDTPSQIRQQKSGRGVGKKTIESLEEALTYAMRNEFIDRSGTSGDTYYAADYRVPVEITRHDGRYSMDVYSFKNHCTDNDDTHSGLINELTDQLSQKSTGTASMQKQVDPSPLMSANFGHVLHGEGRSLEDIVSHFNDVLGPKNQVNAEAVLGKGK